MHTERKLFTNGEKGSETQKSEGLGGLGPFRCFAAFPYVWIGQLKQRASPQVTALSSQVSQALFYLNWSGSVSCKEGPCWWEKKPVRAFSQIKRSKMCAPFIIP